MLRMAVLNRINGWFQYVLKENAVNAINQSPLFVQAQNTLAD